VGGGGVNRATSLLPAMIKRVKEEKKDTRKTTGGLSRERYAELGVTTIIREGKGGDTANFDKDPRQTRKQAVTVAKRGGKKRRGLV